MSDVLKDRNILITGGSGQIGKELVSACLREGAEVAVTCRTEEKKKVLDNELDGVSVFVLDINGGESSLDRLCSELRECGFSPDVLVNCARSIDTLITDAGIPAWENWVKEYEIDVVAPYMLTLKLRKELAENKGAVINVSSMYGITAVNKGLYDNPEWMSPIHYSAAKAAQIHLTKEMAVRFAEEGIRVNSVSYGGVEGRVDDDFKKSYARLCPSGRMLKTEDIQGAVVFLASEASSGVVGHNLVVDGGWTIW